MRPVFRHHDQTHKETKLDRTFIIPKRTYLPSDYINFSGRWQRNFGIVMYNINELYDQARAIDNLLGLRKQLNTRIASD